MYFLCFSCLCFHRAYFVFLLCIPPLSQLALLSPNLESCNTPVGRCKVCCLPVLSEKEKKTLIQFLNYMATWAKWFLWTSEHNHLLVSCSWCRMIFSVCPFQNILLKDDVIYDFYKTIWTVISFYVWVWFGESASGVCFPPFLCHEVCRFLSGLECMTSNV